MTRLHPPLRIGPHLPFHPLAAALALAAGLLLWAAPGRAEPQRFVLDPEHMTVAFLVEHIGYQRILGIFRKVEGSFVYDEAARRLSDLRVTVDTASIDTFHERRDEHLRSRDFLDADAHPQMTFVQRSAEPTGERTGRVTGDLTLRGVTRPVTLDVTLNKIGEYPFGPRNYVIGVSVRGELQRSAFGMTYAVANGLVGDRVELIIEAEAIRQ